MDDVAPLPGESSEERRRSTVWRTLAVIAALAMFLFWLWIFTGGPRKANPDRLDDRAFVERAEARCDRLLTDLEDVQAASEADSATERAAALDRANVLVMAMVDDLEADAPLSGDDRKSLDGWFQDWNAYLDDRRTYADALRVDPDAQLRITENTELRDGVDKTIEIFADVNDMPSCATPGDVG